MTNSAFQQVGKKLCKAQSISPLGVRSGLFGSSLIPRAIRSKIRAASLIAAFISFSPLPAEADVVPREIQGATTISAAGLVDLYQAEADLVIVDSRSRVDFESGHIEGAFNISDNILTEESLSSIGAAAKTKPILFYCNGITCGRAANAVRKALGWGYSRVFYYALGLDEWKANRLPLATHIKH